MSSKEQVNDLNLERNLSRQLRYQTDVMVTNFLTKHDGKFERKVLDQEIVKDSNELRKNVLNMLEKTCSIVFSLYGKRPDEIDSKILKKIEEYGENSEVLTDEEKSVVDNINTYGEFIKKHGWFEHAGAGIRHQISRDEVAYELCEVIRKVYYVHMENKIPEKYKTEIIEQYNMKEENASAY